MTTGSDADTGPVADEALARRHDVALLDLDGVVYAGRAAVPNAVAALASAVAAGMRLAFVTNNASRTPSAVSEQLRSLGIDARDDDVVTSAQAGARVLAGLVPSGSAVLVVGGAGLLAAVGERGLRPVRSAAESPAGVIQGFDPEVGWRALAEAAYALATGVPWVATNTDLTIPTGRGVAPGNGSLVAVLATTTGRAPVVAGKPEPPLMRESVDRTRARTPLVVGDRLDTDIEGAVRSGLPSLLVMTGVTRPADLPGAPPGRRPTYVGADLTALLEGGEPLQDSDGSDGPQGRCGGWVATVHDGAVRLAAQGRRWCDGVLAVSGAVWQAADAGLTVAYDDALAAIVPR